MAVLGEQIRAKRESFGWTQFELAARCNLDIRTIQRIENGKVSPRLYTLKIIEDILGVEFSGRSKFEDGIIQEYRQKFQRRKVIRIVIAFLAAFSMLAVALSSLNSWRLFGIPRDVWVPYFYGLMFLFIIGIGIVWRCPGCNASLGEVFSTYYCNKCGLRLDK